MPYLKRLEITENRVRLKITENRAQSTEKTKEYFL